jgi:serine/threonine protein kinase
MPMTPGARLGPYDLQSRLGGGGMGEVWKAYDAKLQRTVAIRVLHDTADAASRIRAEARAASALNHPHICTIHDVGDANGQSFIVMEHVEGSRSAR